MPHETRLEKHSMQRILACTNKVVMLDMHMELPVHIHFHADITFTL